MGPVPLGGSSDTGKILSPWEHPSPLRDQLGQKGSFRGECSSQIAAGRTERDQHRGSWPPPCTPQPEIHVCWFSQGLGAETWASADRPGERTWRQPEGHGVRSKQWGVVLRT